MRKILLIIIKIRIFIHNYGWPRQHNFLFKLHFSVANNNNNTDDARTGQPAAAVATINRRVYMKRDRVCGSPWYTRFIGKLWS